MGLEAECTVRVGRKSSDGKALLETETLVFRGDFRLNLPFADMRAVTVDDGDLVIRTGEQEARFELGEALATRWARLIKEPKGLFEKLEVAAESRVAVVDVTDGLFLTALRERVASVAEGRVPQGAQVIFFGAETRDALRKVQLLRARMTDTGAIWVVRPKGSKAIAESDVLEAIRGAGLADTKVVAFSKTHTAHKAIVPLEQRGQPVRRRPAIVSVLPPPPGATGDGAEGKAESSEATRGTKSDAAENKAKKKSRPPVKEE